MITTVIPTIGRDTLWTRAIPSVLAQSGDWRCIVVGDGVDIPAFDDWRISTFSIDARDYEDGLERWRIGGIDAFNAGLDAATTEWVSYLADDDEYTPNHHADLGAIASDGVDCVYGQSVVPGQLNSYGTHWPPEPFDIVQGSYILRTSLGWRAQPSTRGESWDADWWRRIIASEARFHRIPEIVHYYHPDPENRGYHSWR